jgi:hypothetical protein
METYMFLILEDLGYKINEYYTNSIMAKNDGALITFIDSNGIRQNVYPATIRIEINIDDNTHLAKSL